MNLWPHPRAERIRLDAEIAIVTTDVGLAGQLTSALTVFGATVHCADNHQRLFEMPVERLDCAIIDACVSATSIIATCRRLRGSESAVPVIVVGVELEEIDRLALYEAGADVVLTGAIFPSELVARIYNILWRTRPLAVVPQLSLGSMAVDLNLEKVSCCGSRVHLRPTEMRLLKFFMRHPARVISRRQLAVGLYRDPSAESRTIDQHVCRLRRALQCRVTQDPIRTVHGQGYVLDRDVLNGASAIVPAHVDRRRRQTDQGEAPPRPAAQS